MISHRRLREAMTVFMALPGLLVVLRVAFGLGRGTGGWRGRCEWPAWWVRPVALGAGVVGAKTAAVRGRGRDVPSAIPAAVPAG